MRQSLEVPLVAQHVSYRYDGGPQILEDVSMVGNGFMDSGDGSIRRWKINIPVLLCGFA